MSFWKASIISHILPELDQRSGFSNFSFLFAYHPSLIWFVKKERIQFIQVILIIYNKNNNYGSECGYKSLHIKSDYVL